MWTEYLAVLEVTARSGHKYTSTISIWGYSTEDAARAAEAIGEKSDEPAETRLLGITVINRD